MPDIRNRYFLIFFSGLLLSFASFLSTPLYAKTPVLFKLTPQDIDWIGHQIYQNETGGNPKHLTFWSKDEAFPSFGIGHFIWTRSDQDVPFEQTFPAMVKYVSKQGPLSKPPKWLRNLSPFDPPWPNKQAFDADFDSPRMQKMRQWLLSTEREQTQFILHRFEQKLNQALNRLSITDKWKAKETIGLMSTHKYGMYALIDYFNFKGLGNNPKETYQGKGWGLIDVLLAMPSVRNQDVLTDFVNTAKQILKRRTQLAPAGKNEKRWLPGWYKRLDGYLHQSPAQVKTTP